MPRALAYFVVVPILEIERNRSSLVGFLDMLRYDGAHVIDTGHDWVLLRRDRPFTEGRWQSFGLPLIGPYIGDPDDVLGAGQELLPQFVETSPDGSKQVPRA